MPLKHQLQIRAAFKNGATFLKDSFHTQPFKLANITEDKKEGILRLMITSSSPGVLNNDQNHFDITIEENASIHLTTQGFQRIFSKATAASQSVHIRLGNQASFIFLPHPVVPHAASQYVSTNHIEIQKTHHLVWSEIITCGRKLCGEEFKFTKFQNITQIYLDGKLAIKENVVLEPSREPLHTMGLLEGFTHQSTLLFLNDAYDMSPVAIEGNRFLSEKEDIIFGISRLPVNGLIFRMLGHKGEQLFEFNNKVALLIQRVMQTQPAPSTAL
jgi:urease accessory protein